MNSSPTHNTYSGCIPVNGRIFEDTIDGYFPLEESVRQLLLRHQFGSAWISIVEAPFIYLQDLPATSPVPMKLLADTPGGIIQYMALIAYLQEEQISLRGVARWAWLTEDPSYLNTLPKDCRLAEPAFVRGIGLLPGQINTRSFGQILQAEASSDIALVDLANQSAREALDRLGWDTGIFWGLQHEVNNILALNQNPACLGDLYVTADKTKASTGNFEYLIANLRDSTDLDVGKRLATER